MNRARNSWQKRMITESLKTPSFSSWIHFIGTRTPRRSDSTRSIQTSTTYSLKDQFPVLCPGELQHKHMFWSSLLKKSANERHENNARAASAYLGVQITTSKDN